MIFQTSVIEILSYIIYIVEILLNRYRNVLKVKVSFEHFQNILKIPPQSESRQNLRWHLCLLGWRFATCFFQLTTVAPKHAGDRERLLARGVRAVEVASVRLRSFFIDLGVDSLAGCR